MPAGTGYGRGKGRNKREAVYDPTSRARKDATAKSAEKQRRKLTGDGRNPFEALDRMFKMPGFGRKEDWDAYHKASSTAHYDQMRERKRSKKR